MKVLNKNGKRLFVIFICFSFLAIAVLLSIPAWVGSASADFHYRVYFIDKPVYVNLKYPTSVKELEVFLAKDDTSEILYVVANSEGIIKLNMKCFAKALRLQKQAAKQGIRLDLIPATREDYKRWYGVEIPKGERHVICGAYIEKKYYYIEPDTDEIKFICYNPR